jgi:glycosyltransferase involved in cell wall biosynthesis
VGHQHELAKLSFIKTYDLIYNPYRSWGTSHRPFPEKCRWVTHFRKDYYDFAILHVDQQSIYDPEKGDRIHKGKLYMELRQVIGDDCPIVTINHMTPFHDKYDSPYVVDFIKKMTEGTLMICNSYEAKKQWGWGHTVIHGISPEEWFDLPKEPRAVTVLSQAGMEKAYRRRFLTEVMRILEGKGVPFVWVGYNKTCESFREYREFLGRSLIYFNPTWQSPRPRARTEAQMSGCCVVTTPYQDAHTYIKDGVNGFLTSRTVMKNPNTMDNPEYTARLIKRLVMDEPRVALKVGQKGKETARKLFSFNSFEKQWRRVVRKIGVEL